VKLREEYLDDNKEESDKLLDLKVKLQRHETKKQMFSFNMYKVRKISDHDLFKKEVSEKSDLTSSKKLILTRQQSNYIKL